MPTQDLIDQLVGLADGDALHAVRHQREKVVAATQGSLQALFDPALPGLPLVERLAVAVYACRLTPAPELAAYYLDASRPRAPTPPCWTPCAMAGQPARRAWPPSSNSRAS